MRLWKQALRGLARRPGFSLAVFGLLVLGIGANTALFSLVETVVWKPLPYPHPSQLVKLMEASPAQSQKVSLAAPGRLEDWNRLSRTFVAISGSYAESVTDTSGADPERLNGQRVAPRYFRVFGVAPLVGRTFVAEEERFGGPQAAVISYGLWNRRYGQDPRITSRRLVIGGQGYSILGVMPRNFVADSIDVWLPAQHPATMMRFRTARFYTGIGRIKPRFTQEQARADLAGVQRALGEQFPQSDKGWSVALQDFKAWRIGDFGNPLLLLFGAVTLLLLITVTNVAGLILAQLQQREREMAIRASIGASRRQAIGAVLREIVLLAAAGALGGWVAAAASLRLLAQLFANVPRIGELAMDWRALAFAVGAGLIGALAFGLFPALRATSPKYAGSILRGGHRISGKRQSLQRALVAGEIALTMALLAGASLLLRSFQNLSNADLGFNPSHVLIFHVGAAWDEDRSRIGRLQENLIADLRRLPGVQAAGIANFLPASGATLRYQVVLEGIATDDNEGKMPVGERTVSPGYLQALQAPLVAGAWCPELRTDPLAPLHAMVNRRFVDVYAHGLNVVGRHVQFEGAQMEIVGVIGDMKEDAVESPRYPYLYFCAMGGTWPDPQYTVRTAGDPRELLPSIRELVHGAAPNRALFGVQTLEDALADDLRQPRSNSRLLTLFGLTAMGLAAVGIYGLVSQMVSARRREIGIRMAVGADPSQIVWSFLAGAGRLLGAGILMGLGVLLAARPVLRSLVFGISPLDAWSIGAAAGVLSIISVLAAFRPARRAAAIDPVETLRAE
jgi:putative ABC transport system permease protein